MGRGIVEGPGATWAVCPGLSVSAVPGVKGRGRHPELGKGRLDPHHPNGVRLGTWALWRPSTVPTCAGDLHRLPFGAARPVHHLTELPLRTVAPDRWQRGIRGPAGVSTGGSPEQLLGRRDRLATVQHAAHSFSGAAVPRRGPAHGLPGRVELDLHHPAAAAAPVHQAGPCKCQTRAERRSHTLPFSPVNPVGELG